MFNLHILQYNNFNNDKIKYDKNKFMEYNLYIYIINFLIIFIQFY